LWARAISVRDEAKDAEVLVHNWETGHRIGRLEYEEHRTLLVRAGVPADEIETMRKMYEGVRKYADSFGGRRIHVAWDELNSSLKLGSLRIFTRRVTRPARARFFAKRIAP
jgi:hypothetical protein